MGKKKKEPNTHGTKPPAASYGGPTRSMWEELGCARVIAMEAGAVVVMLGAVGYMVVRVLA